MLSVDAHRALMRAHVESARVLRGQLRLVNYLRGLLGLPAWEIRRVPDTRAGTPDVGRVLGKGEELILPSIAADDGER